MRGEGQVPTLRWNHSEQKKKEAIEARPKDAHQPPNSR